MIANSRKATPSGSTRRASKRIRPTRRRTRIFTAHRSLSSTMEFVEHAIWLMRRKVGKWLCKYCTPAQDQLDINTWLDCGEPEDEEDVDGGSGGQFPSSFSRRYLAFLAAGAWAWKHVTHVVLGTTGCPPSWVWGGEIRWHAVWRQRPLKPRLEPEPSLSRRPGPLLRVFVSPSPTKPSPSPGF